MILSDGTIPAWLARFMSLDMMPMLAGTLACLACGLLGNFLVLRRLSLMGDAISHAVLPGLVVAFLVAGSASAWPMFVGAAVAGVVTALLVEVVRGLGRVESGAAMGVVFCVLFALGVLLIERAARRVHLDADCVLYGQLATLWWDAPRTWRELLGAAGTVPRQVWTLAAAACMSAGLVVVLFKELRLAAFDAGLASSLGFSAWWLHIVLMVAVAAVSVASFEAVGSILVIAMLIVPASTARMLTDRLVTQMWVSAAASVVSGVAGYALASWLPIALGAERTLNAAGMITCVAGTLLLAAILGGPRHGVVSRVLRLRAQSMQVAIDDVLAMLYRRAEAEAEPEVAGQRAGEGAIAATAMERRALAKARALGLVRGDGAHATLTPAGAERGRAVVRRHRLWESFLVGEAGLEPDHVHGTAERLEHVGIEPRVRGDVDPHGKRIPGA